MLVHLWFISWIIILVRRTENVFVTLYACCFSQANTNEIVLASTHDVQEVDVSTLLAAQPFTWIGEDFDKESRRSVHLSVCVSLI